MGQLVLRIGYIQKYNPARLCFITVLVKLASQASSFFVSFTLAGRPPTQICSQVMDAHVKLECLVASGACRVLYRVSW